MINFRRSNRRFQVPKLQPGAVVALHSRYTSRFARMNGDDLNNIYMDMSDQKPSSALPSDWTSEKAACVRVVFHDFLMEIRC